MEHSIREFVYVPPVIYQSADIVYNIKGDQGKANEIKISGFMIVELTEHGGKLKGKRFEIYLDPCPVMKRIEELHGHSKAS